MAKIHDLFIIELAEVIKGYGNDPDVEDPFRLSEFYRFYELPNIAVSRENFEKMRPAQPEQRWVPVAETETLPDEGQECWITSKEGAVYQGMFTRCYGDRRDSGFILNGFGFAWLNTIVAWMPFARPKPWKGEEDEKNNNRN